MADALTCPEPTNVASTYTYLSGKTHGRVNCGSRRMCCCNSGLFPQGDKGDKGIMGPRGIKGHTGHKGEQVGHHSLHITTDCASVKILITFCCVFLSQGPIGLVGPKGSMVSRKVTVKSYCQTSEVEKT